MTRRTFNRQVALTRLIDLCLATRTDWDEPGTRHAIRKADTDGHSFDVIARASIHAATTASTTTPAGITTRLRDGWGLDDGWTKEAIDSKKHLPTGPSHAYPRCSNCKREILGGETRETHRCDGWTGPGLTERVRAELAAVRQQLETDTERHTREAREAAERARQTARGDAAEATVDA